jgi:hypothetical protein
MLILSSVMKKHRGFPTLGISNHFTLDYSQCFSGIYMSEALKLCTFTMKNDKRILNIIINILHENGVL